MADDDLQERIARLGEGESDPPQSESDRPSQVTIRFDSGKGKIKWGRTILACVLALGSIAEMLAEIVSKDGPIAHLVKTVCR